jgi:hypothetical protein
MWESFGLLPKLAQQQENSVNRRSFWVVKLGWNPEDVLWL